MMAALQFFVQESPDRAAARRNGAVVMCAIHIYTVAFPGFEDARGWIAAMQAIYSILVKDGSFPGGPGFRVVRCCGTTMQPICGVLLLDGSLCYLFAWSSEGSLLPSLCVAVGWVHSAVLVMALGN
jgi:hypothetical protein